MQLIKRAKLFLNQLENTNKIDDSKYQEALEKQEVFNQSVAQAVLNKDGMTSDALASIESYVPVWEVEKEYKGGQLVAYEGKVYVVIMDTMSNEKVKPDKAKTSYQEYRQSAVYLDAFGRVIDIQN